MKQDYLKLIRRLTVLLIISGTFNMGLTAFFIYWMVKERPPTPYCEHLPASLKRPATPLAAGQPLMEAIGRYKDLPFDLLISELANNELIEDHFTRRDLALAFLVSIHHFDLQRAVQSRVLSHRQKMRLPQEGEHLELVTYPGLKDSDYESILHFAHTEEWPITPFGMYLKLQNQERTPSLEEAFYHTPHFMAVEMLFGRTDKPIERSELLQMMLEGTWEMLSTYYSEQRMLLDLSRTRRQQFLLSYVDCGSKTAASLLLKMESTQTGRLTNHAANDRPPMNPSRRMYTVQEGDSLWKIAKNHRISVSKLTSANNLDESTVLQPGMQLSIP